MKSHHTAAAELAAVAYSSQIHSIHCFDGYNKGSIKSGGHECSTPTGDDYITPAIGTALQKISELSGFVKVVERLLVDLDPLSG